MGRVALLGLGLTFHFVWLGFSTKKLKNRLQNRRSVPPPRRRKSGNRPLESADLLTIYGVEKTAKIGFAILFVFGGHSDYMKISTY